MDNFDILNVERYVTCSAAGFNLAIPATEIKEIQRLPELISLPKTSGSTAGMLHYRGCFIPAIDGRLFLGGKRERFLLSDTILVLDTGTEELALIVDSIGEIVAADERSPGDVADDLEINYQMFNDGPRLRVDTAQILASIDSQAAESFKQENITPLVFSQATTDMENDVLSARAAQLSKVKLGEAIPVGDLYCIVSLGTENYAFPVDSILEFSEIADVVPVPCAHSHIVGNYNLRGEVITLFDFAKHLGTAPTDSSQPCYSLIFSHEESRAGIIVNQIHDVLTIVPDDILDAPCASAGDFVTGISNISGLPVSIVNFSALLESVLAEAQSA